MNTEKLIATIRKAGAKIEAEKDFLTELDNVIGVAGGARKAEAILAALRGGYLDVLITDEDTAKLLLETPEP